MVIGFLRRNPAFQRDFRAVRQQGQCSVSRTLSGRDRIGGRPIALGCSFSPSLVGAVRSCSGVRPGASMCCRSSRNRRLHA